MTIYIGTYGCEALSIYSLVSVSVNEDCITSPKPAISPLSCAITVHLKFY